MRLGKDGQPVVAQGPLMHPCSGPRLGCGCALVAHVAIAEKLVYFAALGVGTTPLQDEDNRLGFLLFLIAAIDLRCGKTSKPCRQ